MDASYKNGLTALAGGGQAGATQLYPQTLSRVTVVATTGDSGILAPSAPGLTFKVANAGANAMNVFPAVGEAINALAVNAAFSVPAGKIAVFECAVAGTWSTLLSA